MAVEIGTPATIWNGRGGEYAPSGPFLLADTSGKLLVDTTGNSLIDSGVIFVPLQPTVWSRNDAL